LFKVYATVGQEVHLSYCRSLYKKVQLAL